ncbi:hypothetical protein J2X69_000688 [Algoriphagus sp. 4150]|nr:hypothetical protein [Algoriphagus sp. 4150]
MLFYVAMWFKINDQFPIFKFNCQGKANSNLCAPWWTLWFNKNTTQFKPPELNLLKYGRRYVCYAFLCGYVAKKMINFQFSTSMVKGRPTLTFVFLGGLCGSKINTTQFKPPDMDLLKYGRLYVCYASMWLKKMINFQFSNPMLRESQL